MMHLPPPNDDRCNEPVAPIALGVFPCALRRHHGGSCEPYACDVRALQDALERARRTNPEWFDDTDR